MIKYNLYSNILTFFARISLVLFITGLFFPLMLYLLKGDSITYGLPLTLFICFIFIERFWFSLFTSKESDKTRVAQDWSVVAVGLAYIIMVYGTLFEFYIYFEGTFMLAFIIGLLFFIISFLLRWWSVSTLGNQWGIHVDGLGRLHSARRQLIRSGPYKYVRHPIYLAAIIEVISIPLMFAAFYTLLFSVMVCIPLQICRAYFEESGLKQIFGDEYSRYVREVNAFLPIPRPKQSPPEQ